MINLNVPFYSNTEDDTHCFQAVLRMMLAFFQPNQLYSWDQLDDISAKKPNLWTWPYASLLWLTENDFQVVRYSSFDDERFSRDGVDYLEVIHGKEVATIQAKNSDLEQEQALALQISKRAITRREIPTIESIKTLLQDGYLVTCDVNARILNGFDGYSGHAVLVKGFDEDTLIIHDPGLPAFPNRRISAADFEKAWAYPSASAKDLIAVKL